MCKFNVREIEVLYASRLWLLRWLDYNRLETFNTWLHSGLTGGITNLEILSSKLETGIFARMRSGDAYSIVQKAIDEIEQVY